MSTTTLAPAAPKPAEAPLRPPSPDSPVSSLSSAGSTLYDSPPTRQTALGTYTFPAVKQEEGSHAWGHPQNPMPRFRRQSRPSYEFPATGGGGDYGGAAQAMERGSYQAKRLSITGMTTYEAAVRGGEGGYSALGKQVVEGGGIGRSYSWSAYPDFGVASTTDYHDGAGGHPGYSTTLTHSYSHYYAADARAVPPPPQQYPAPTLSTTHFQWAPPPPPAPAPALHHHHSYTSDYGGSPEEHYRPLPHPDHRPGVYPAAGRPFVYGTTSLAPPPHYGPYTPASSHHMVRSTGHSYHHQSMAAGGYDAVVYPHAAEHERDSSSGGYGGQQSCNPLNISDEPRSPYIYSGGGADGGERPGHGVGTSYYDRSSHDSQPPRSTPRSSTRPLRTTRRANAPSRSRSSTPPTPARRAKSKIYHPPPSASTASSIASHMPSIPTDAQFAIMPTKRSRGRRPPDAPSQIEEPRKKGKTPKMFVCKVPRCGKWFKRSEHLKRHVRSIHTDEKPFQCQWPACAKFFSRHDNLNQHLRVHRVQGTSDLEFSVQLEACFGPGGVRGDKALGLVESERDNAGEGREWNGEESWDSE